MIYDHIEPEDPNELLKIIIVTLVVSAITYLATLILFPLI